jgi:hypothetical protein
MQRVKALCIPQEKGLWDQRKTNSSRDQLFLIGFLKALEWNCYPLWCRCESITFKETYKVCTIFNCLAMVNYSCWEGKEAWYDTWYSEDNMSHEISSASTSVSTATSEQYVGWCSTNDLRDSPREYDCVGSFPVNIFVRITHTRI